jgi:hypothetical protein
MSTRDKRFEDWASELSTAPFEPQARRVVSDAGEGSEQLQILSLWPPRAATCVGGHTWKVWGPQFHHDFVDHPLPDTEEFRYVGDFWGWDTDLESLVAWIPAGVQRALDGVSYGDYWASLTLIDLFPKARAVFEAAPVLGAALALQLAGATDHTAATERLRLGLDGPPHLLLELLDLPAEPWAYEVMGRLDENCLWRFGGLDLIRAALTSDQPRVQRLVRELAYIREDVLGILAKNRLEMVNDSLLADPDECIVATLEIRLDEIARARRDDLIGPTPARFSSRAEVLEAHCALQGATLPPRRRQS